MPQQCYVLRLYNVVSHDIGLCAALLREPHSTSLCFLLFLPFFGFCHSRACTRRMSTHVYDKADDNDNNVNEHEQENHIREAQEMFAQPFFVPFFSFRRSYIQEN